MVGCVLVRGGQVVGEGFHRRFGADHAEVEALANCRKRGQQPAGCDVYVNLEPCCHQGKTGPCTEALIAAGVGRVFVAMVDPFEKVAGQGLGRLRAAGIEVVTGVCDQEAQKLNEPYVKRTTTGLPWVIVKWAQTLDGAIATATGDSQWISNQCSRKVVHQLRARVDAVVVGIGTVLADDPQLTARGVVVKRAARRVVMDPDLRLPTGCKLLRSMDQSNPLTIAVRQQVLADRPAKVDQLADAGVELVGLAGDGEDAPTLQWRALLEHLCVARSATNVLVEGGAKVISTLMRQQMVDQVIAFVAPKLVGDENALRPVQGFATSSIEQACGLTLNAVKRVGGDVMLDYRRAPGG
jgi:diaminohydroxyphosphoribosylaminopyrimidine deaminase/5-amino-6-(5-phosphoribosylamino)uracil reductase